VIGWFTRELSRWFDEFTSTPEGLIDGGDRIVVPVHVQARAQNGKATDVHNVWIYEFREGKLIRGRVYADTASRSKCTSRWRTASPPCSAAAAAISASVGGTR